MHLFKVVFRHSTREILDAMAFNAQGSMLLYPTLLYHVACHVITNESANLAVETVT